MNLPRQSIALALTRECNELNKTCTQKITQNLPYLTLREKSKATTKPCFSRLLHHPATKQTEWVYSGTQNTHTCLLTYLLDLDPHGGCKLNESLDKSL